MLRHAARRLVYVPGITLDFLLPRHFSARAATGIRTEVEPRHETPPSQPKTRKGTVETAQSSSSSAQAPLTVSGMELEVFEQATVGLRAALVKGDAEAAVKLWSLLDQKRLTSFLGAPDYKDYCYLIGELPEQLVSALPPDILHGIEDIVVVAAANGVPGGLQLRVSKYLQGGRPEEAIRLFLQLEHLHSSRNALKSTLGPPAAEDHDPFLEELQTDAPSTTVPLSILIYTIAAYAMKDDFRGALTTSLRASTSLTRTHVKVFLPQANLPLAVQTKTEEFATKLIVAQILSRPGHFERRIAAIARSSAGRRSVTLRSLYDTVMLALDGPQPWITLDPSKVSDETPVLLPPTFWSTYLKACLKSRQMELAERLWDDMTKFNVPTTMDVWTALLEGYAELRMSDRGLQTWEMMEKQNLVPSIMAHRALIFCLFNSGLPDQAMRFFARFESQVKAGRHSTKDQEALILYNTVLHWLLLNTRVSDAEALFDRMKQQGPKPDVVSYNSWMRYHARTGHLGALAALLEEMSSAGIKEDVVTYTTILTALLPKDPNASQTVFNLMKKRGIEANVHMYTAVIDSLMKQETVVALDAAFDMLQKMEAENAENVRPNAITYTTVLCGLHRYRWTNPAVAEEYKRVIIYRMETKNMMQSTVTYNILIKACFENPAAEGAHDALKYYRDMLRKRVEPNNDTWYILLLGLVRQRDWDQAEMVVGHIGKRRQTVPASLMSLIATVKQQRDVRPRTRKTYAL